MKTICLDLRPLQIGHQNRGIGMHIRSILENLPESDDKYLFYCFDTSNPIEDLAINTKVNYTVVYTPVVKTALDSPTDFLKIFRLIGHRFKPLKKYRPDAFVQFDFMLGMPRWRRVKKVIFGYDVIPLIMKNDYLPGIRYAWNHTAGKKAKLRAITRSLYYRMRYSLQYRTYKRADKILCISEASAESFRSLLHIDDSKLSVSYLAPVAASSEVDLSTAESIEKPYIFYIGGTDKRKSISDIVHAFNIVRGRGLDAALVLAGNEFKKVKDVPDVAGRNSILASPYSKDIRLAGFVTDSQKRGLYKRAHAFVFCSKFEGFGLPVLEAQSEGCPVVAYNNSSIPEVSSNSVQLVDTGDIVEVAKRILAIPTTPALREKAAQKGVAKAKKFTWKAHVESFLEAL